MKLPIAEKNIPLWLAEFDLWITPCLADIKDSDRFGRELDIVANILDIIGSATQNFQRLEDCHPEAIAEQFINFINSKTQTEAETHLQAFSAVLFLVTGKSDNNAKCQLPLYLRDVARWDKFPKVNETQNKSQVGFQQIPRVLTAENYMKRVASLRADPDQQQRLLQEFVNFLLNDDSCISQLWSIGRSYFMLKEFKKERDLLTPLVIFQVRGSVAASGGHEPEKLLRQRLAEWGLRENIDYNTTDVNLTSVNANKKEKKRAYDFVLPYQTPHWTGNWGKRIFIQCQFYAGDSGSVSHKNVDQTKASREYVLKIAPDARFVEYVDGAGYFSSLNGDLKKLLEMPNTGSFFQVRTAAIRLRRELQQLGFLVPLDLEHGIIRCSDRTVTSLYQILLAENYDREEIDRCLQDCIQRGLIILDNGILSLIPERRTIARRYFLLDVVAGFGNSLGSTSKKLTGSLMIPGYGSCHSMKLDDLVSKSLNLTPSLRTDWTDPTVFPRDIRWLCDEGLAET